MSCDVKLGDQQYALLEVLWQLGEGGAGAVRTAMGARAPAHTTVATLLTRMEKKGVLKSRMKGRERLYRPLVGESEVKRSMVGSMVNTLFRGDASALLAHMVREGDIDQSELDAMRDMLDAPKDEARAVMSQKGVSDD